MLEIEKDLEELAQKILQLKKLLQLGERHRESELRRLQREFREKARKAYQKLDPWDRVQLARHPKRPHTMDLIPILFEEFTELHGDRLFGDDRAVVAGFAYFEGMPVAVIGHEKGRSTKEKMERNFGMPHPEGYRKAVRIAKLAESYGMPVITFVDTAGAYPGVGAEERGQAEAIAQCLYTFGYLRTPVVSVVIGEGGSGGALAFGVANRVYMLENAVYSVISPEGCAAILWKDQSKVKEAAKALKLTSWDLLRLGVIDGIIREPLGGAHWDYMRTARLIKRCLRKALRELLELTPERLVEDRIKKFSSMGVFQEVMP
ncbi:acetyl-CoA carboxylase, carboxyl transferase, alpha subunit [Thermocrinis albus DSM 14484]|uniref:Acetyl-coenzyme A carboxylase carboxyl transferase subunit alpha n=1 Tax=Thermocrinis albus (strain DSM 14484 / JCM 11386 / HI 11/12) TaxID=638303 RepID=D3SP93_THEAH|nr:acetyl-CoA carboxylase carboxyltransferase subunit alpha [Thermocrinis albus]ADC88980.1 acetyl-CoA carboxylase, carboxyl transferase, alpha subunit [Thermocrinis albus DSM 14484]